MVREEIKPKKRLIRQEIEFFKKHLKEDLGYLYPGLNYRVSVKEVTSRSWMSFNVVVEISSKKKKEGVATVINFEKEQGPIIGKVLDRYHKLVIEAFAELAKKEFIASFKS